METLGIVPWAVVLCGVTAAAVTDIWKYKVYNVLTLPLAATGLLYHVVTGGGSGLMFGVGGLMLGFAVLVIPYAFGGIGAGDVKLLAALGAWLGIKVTFWLFVIAGLAGGVYALILMVPNGGFRNIGIRLAVFFYQIRSLTMHLGTEERVEEIAKGDDRRKRLIPFAALLAVAVITLLVLWLDTHEVKVVVGNGRPI